MDKKSKAGNAPKIFCREFGGLGFWRNAWLRHPDPPQLIQRLFVRVIVVDHTTDVSRFILCRPSLPFGKWKFCKKYTRKDEYRRVSNRVKISSPGEFPTYWRKTPHIDKGTAPF